MAETKAEARQAAFRGCERLLAGHGRRTPQEVLAALADEVGQDERPDVYGKGALIEDLEREVATLLGKPAAVFMPSGTMAQQIALRLWSERRGGRPVAFHPTCHLELHEQRGYAALHGLQARLVGARHRVITRADLDAIVEPLSALLLELPQREIGGQLPTWDELEAQAAWAREHGVALHLDGARLWETGPFYDRPYAEIAGHFDSVYVSFYKILGGLAGAVLAGPDDLVAEARIWLRRHGGNLYALYPYVLGARAGLRTHLPRIPDYVRRAGEVAKVLRAIPGVTLIPDPPQTNMMHLALSGDPERLLDASADIARTEGVCLLTHLRQSDVPGRGITELTIGEAAFAIADDELDRLYRRLLAAGQLAAEL